MTLIYLIWIIQVVFYFCMDDKEHEEAKFNPQTGLFNYGGGNLQKLKKKPEPYEYDTGEEHIAQDVKKQKHYLTMDLDLPFKFWKEIPETYFPKDEFISEVISEIEKASLSVKNRKLHQIVSGEFDEKGAEGRCDVRYYNHLDLSSSNIEFKNGKTVPCEATIDYGDGSQFKGEVNEEGRKLKGAVKDSKGRSYAGRFEQQKGKNSSVFSGKVKVTERGEEQPSAVVNLNEETIIGIGPNDTTCRLKKNNKVCGGVDASWNMSVYGNNPRKPLFEGLVCCTDDSKKESQENNQQHQKKEDKKKDKKKDMNEFNGFSKND